MAPGAGARRPLVWRYLLAAALLILVSLGLGTIVPRPLSDLLPAADATDSRGSGNSRTVLLLSSEIHTDLALPVTPDVVA
jgi:hypothetical protein